MNFHTDKIVNQVAQIVGGRPDMAMAGGKETENLDKIFYPEDLKKIIDNN